MRPSLDTGPDNFFDSMSFTMNDESVECIMNYPNTIDDLKKFWEEGEGAISAGIRNSIKNQEENFFDPSDHHQIENLAEYKNEELKAHEMEAENEEMKVNQIEVIKSTKKDGDESEAIHARNTFPFTMHSTNFDTDQGNDTTLYNFLENQMARLVQNQNKIDKGVKIKASVGRKRKFMLTKISDIKEYIHNYLFEQIHKGILDKGRKDVLLTNFIRKVKGIFKELVEKYSTMNKYKSSEIEDYSYSYLEAFHAFNSIFPLNQEKYSSDHIPCNEIAYSNNTKTGYDSEYNQKSFLKNYGDFGLISYPKPKVKKILKTIGSQDGRFSCILTAQLELLMNRGLTTKTHIETFARVSEVFRALLSLSLDIIKKQELIHPDFIDNPTCVYLKDVLNQALSSK